MKVTLEQYQIYYEMGTSFEICKICDERNKNAKLEPCGHLLCKPCLKSWEVKFFFFLTNQCKHIVNFFLINKFRNLLMAVAIVHFVGLKLKVLKVYQLMHMSHQRLSF